MCTNLFEIVYRHLEMIRVAGGVSTKALLADSWVVNSQQASWQEALVLNGAVYDESAAVWRRPRGVTFPAKSKVRIPAGVFSGHPTTLAVETLPRCMHLGGAPHCYILPEEAAVMVAVHLGLKRSHQWTGLKINALEATALEARDLKVRCYRKGTRMFFQGFLPVNFQIHNLTIAGPWGSGVFWTT